MINDNTKIYESNTTDCFKEDPYKNTNLFKRQSMVSGGVKCF